ncbi:MAG: FG-GAP repeat domain-containing protein [Candidatus Cyclobacteriaceae bacterium M3_2C_046]
MNHKFLIVLFFITISFSCKKADSPEIEYFDLQSNAWHLNYWSNDHFVLADYDGNVFLRDIHNRQNLWSFPAGSFVFDLKTADLDRDGKKEVAFVTASGDLVVLDNNGNKIWSFHSKLPLYNVGLGNFMGDENLEITCGGIDRHVYVFNNEGIQMAKSPKVQRLVHRIAVGNLNGDDYDEILVVENRTIANLMAMQDKKLLSLWRKPLKVPSELINWENPGGSFFPFSIIIDDLDLDGDNEIIIGDTYFNKQAVLVSDQRAKPLWISEGLPPFAKMGESQIEFYSTAFVRAADIFPEHPGKEIISVAGGMFRIFDYQGNLLGEKNGKVGFTDFIIKENYAFLSSCPNGDEYMYKVKLDSGWQHHIASLEFQGLIRDVKNQTQQLLGKTKDYQPASIPEKQYNMIVGFGSVDTSPEGLIKHNKQMDWFKQRFPYDNLRVIKTLKVMENTPPLNEKGEPWNPRRWKTDAINGTNTVEEILDKARWIEKNRIPTLFYIGHSCMPFISLKTAEKILQIAPNYCLGFYTAEDENIKMVPRYFKYFFQPLADLCLQYGNKLCGTKNKGLWWMSSPAHEEVFSAMFEGGRSEVTLALTEDSNSRTPEINLMGRAGLWQAGLLQNNDVSIHGDLFSFNRFQQWEYPKAGHPYLRLLIAHATTGMTQVNVRTRRDMPDGEDKVIMPMGKESAEFFYHLLGKGIVFSPEPGDALGYSTLGLVVHKPEEKWLEDAYNGHSPEKWRDDSELHNAVFPHNGNLWGMTNTMDHAFQKVVFNKKRQFGYQIPATPYGLVVMVPSQTDLKKVSSVNKWLHTDGIYIWEEGGEKLTGDQAAKFIEQQYEMAAESLLFRQTKKGSAVFMQVLKVSRDHYRLFLLDPGWINPESHRITVKIQMEGDFEAFNTIEKTPLEIEKNSFTVDIPAGLFSIMDVRKI